MDNPVLMAQFSKHSFIPWMVEFGIIGLDDEMCDLVLGIKDYGLTDNFTYGRCHSK